MKDRRGLTVTVSHLERSHAVGVVGLCDRGKKGEEAVLLACSGRL